PPPVARGKPLARAVLDASHETQIPRLLAMFCVLAVFLPSIFMTGVGKALFVPLSLAVGFSMVASYLLSTTFVPPLATWILRRAAPGATHAESPTTPRARLTFANFQERYRAALERAMSWRWAL